jgi:hypothetical protein
MNVIRNRNLGCTGRSQQHQTHSDSHGEFPSIEVGFFDLLGAGERLAEHNAM